MCFLREELGYWRLALASGSTMRRSPADSPQRKKAEANQKVSRRFWNSFPCDRHCPSCSHRVTIELLVIDRQCVGTRVEKSGVNCPRPHSAEHATRRPGDTVRCWREIRGCDEICPIHPCPRGIIREDAHCRRRDDEVGWQKEILGESLHGIIRYLVIPWYRRSAGIPVGHPWDPG